jgi:hypothetical protein
MHCPPQPSASPQRRPTHDGVQSQRSGVPRHVSPIPVHRVPGEQKPPQPSLGVSPHARVDAGVHVGAQHAPDAQRWPGGHITPFGHIGQPGASLGSVPHASVVAFGHVAQHEPPAHVAPGAHAVPIPHVRHTAPLASR